MKKFLCICSLFCLVSPLVVFGEDGSSANSFLHILTSRDDRSAPSPSSSSRFSKNAEGMIKDSATSLMWPDNNWLDMVEDETDGNNHCAQLTLGGHDDWRFPTVNELQAFYQGVDADTSFTLKYWGSFAQCKAVMGIGGYIRTPYGAQQYGGNTGDPIGFSGHAAVRCVRNS